MEGYFRASPVELFSFGLIILATVATSVYAFMHSFLGKLIRDSMDKEKHALFVRFRHCAARRDDLHNHIHYAEIDGDRDRVARLRREQEEANEECKALARVIGRPVKPA
mmetsp:Transcript_83744/g.224006  ORF Transcript_83744/g.224006 Transcript_83744/m.224006 type:complete len:109 (-) Transcript_83744:18-344(-)